MLEKEPSGAMSVPEAAPKSSGASPGGPFPPTVPPAELIDNPPQPSRQFTLQYLIAVIKKRS
jgi:hypothetical protein